MYPESLINMACTTNNWDVLNGIQNHYERLLLQQEEQLRKQQIMYINGISGTTTLPNQSLYYDHNSMTYKVVENDDAPCCAPEPKSDSIVKKAKELKSLIAYYYHRK